MSGIASSPISNSGMVKMWGTPWNSVAIAFPFKSYFLFRFVLPLCRPMSDNVNSDKGRSDMVENVWVAVEIASLSQAAQTLLPLPF